MATSLPLTISEVVITIWERLTLEKLSSIARLLPDRWHRRRDRRCRGLRDLGYCLLSSSILSLLERTTAAKQRIKYKVPRTRPVDTSWPATGDQS